MKVTHIITGLTTGGAEMMLYRLLTPMLKAGIETEVISIKKQGPIGQKIEQLGVKVTHIPILHFPKLVSRLKATAPDVVQTWMYHADLMGGLAARLAGCKNIVWNIQNGTIDPKRTKVTTRFIVRLCARFATRLATRIVACGRTVVDIHAAIGFPRERMKVIYNATDVDSFVPDERAGAAWREQYDIDSSEFVIAQFARFDPQKDYDNLVQAAGLLKGMSAGRFRFVLCGLDVDHNNKQLTMGLKRAGMLEKTLLLGLQDDVRPIMAAADIATLSSRYGEGLPLSVGEAMAMALPCVVTDVGDSAFLVGDTGIVVPPAHPDLLAAGWNQLIAMSAEDRGALGVKARERIVQQFSLQTAASEYMSMYQDLARAAGGD